MLMSLLIIGYILNAAILFLMIVYGKLFVFRKKKPQFVSDYCAGMAIFLGLYSVLSLMFVFLFPTHLSKLIMACFAISPFIIGMMTTYEKEKYYTLLQLLVIAISIYYVI